MSPTVRIVLGEMPRLMVDIVRAAVSRRSDQFQIVAVETKAAEVLSAARRHDAHAVILGTAQSATDGTYEPLLWERPGLRLLALREDGRASELFWVGTHRRDLGAPSADELLDALSNLDNPDDRPTA